MLKKLRLVGSVAALSIAGLAYGQQATVQPSPIKRTSLGKVEVPGASYEVVFGITELAAGHKAGRHSHPGPVLVYVTEGEFWYHIDGQPERVYKAGDSFQVPHSAIHAEGAVGSKSAKVMAVFIVEKGKPLVQMAQ
ncbi:MAG: cupin domain-containing protein [Hyphomicrobiaceae bacterium]|nr:cupin domain-containing protein [Hyphomicrobiaceae bacterium]